MKLAAAIERLERVTATRANTDALPTDLTAALHATSQLTAFLVAVEADLSRRLAAATSFPEATIAETTRGSIHDATRTLDRGRTLEAVPSLADALDNAIVTPGHIDAVTRGAKGLEPAQRQQLFDTADSLADIAAHATVEQFGRRVRDEVNTIIANDGVDRLERQRRATAVTTWVGNDGMWNLRGIFDPVTGMKLASKLDTTVETLFTEATPSTCPSDPIEKQRHLRGLALARLIGGRAGQPAHGRPEFVAVINLDAPPPDRGVPTGRSVPAESGGIRVDWPIPIEVPARVLADMVENADVHVVVVRNGVVLHAPGNLDLGRTTRLANRAQRRALGGLYSHCAIPNCTVTYDRCKLHHIIWWRHDGRTDLDNLLPVCSHHHHKIHDDGWTIRLGTQRQLTLTLPDGTIRTTGPPRRNAA